MGLLDSKIDSDFHFFWNLRDIRFSRLRLDSNLFRKKRRDRFESRIKLPPPVLTVSTERALNRISIQSGKLEEYLSEGGPSDFENLEKIGQGYRF